MHRFGWLNEQEELSQKKKKNLANALSNQKITRNLNKTIILCALNFQLTREWYVHCWAGISVPLELGFQVNHSTKCRN